MGQRTRKRQEDDKSDDRDNDHHDGYFSVAEALPSNYECRGNVPLAGTKGHDPSRMAVGSAKQPTGPETQPDKQKSHDDAPRAEHY